MLHPHDIMTAEQILQLDKLVKQAKEEQKSVKKERGFTDFTQWVKKS